MVIKIQIKIFFWVFEQIKNLFWIIEYGNVDWVSFHSILMKLLYGIRYDYTRENIIDEL